MHEEFTQTQAEQEADLESLRLVLPAGWVAKRCAHETVEQSTMWVLSPETYQQIGVIARVKPSGWHQWRAQSMWRGMPTCAGFSFSNLEDCLEHIKHRNVHAKKYS